jgi:uncharacterized membrane protein
MPLRKVVEDESGMTAFLLAVTHERLSAVQCMLSDIPLLLGMNSIEKSRSQSNFVLQGNKRILCHGYIEQNKPKGNNRDI